MYSINEYNNLTSKYGRFASWAIWDYRNESDTIIISKKIKDLHSKFVLLGLNVSSILKGTNWMNFRGGSHDRKIKFASNDTQLRGSYITDIFKDLPEVDSNKIDKILTKELIEFNVKFFKQEMKDIKVNDKTIFIIFGYKAQKYFNLYFKQGYKNQIIFQRHYSSRGTDKEWVESFWEKMNINQNFDLTIEKYRLSKVL